MCRSSSQKMPPRLAAFSNSSSLAAAASTTSRMVNLELDSHPPDKIAGPLTDDSNVLVLMKALSQVQDEATEIYKSVCTHSLPIAPTNMCAYSIVAALELLPQNKYVQRTFLKGVETEALLTGKRLVSGSSSLYANESSRLSTCFPRRLSRISFRPHSCWRPNPITRNSRRI